MIRAVKRLFRRKFSEGQPRSIQAKRNIAGLFVLRGVSAAINFLLVPLLLSYLNNVNYGVWTTLSSIVGWVIWMDVGLGNGLRNKFATALAEGNQELARVYVSTTYVAVGMVSLGVLVLYWLIQSAVSWSAILNASPAMEGELSALAAVIVTFSCLRLVLGLVGTVLVADQKPVLSSLMDVIISALSLGIVLVLRAMVPGSLFWLGTCISGAAVLVPALASIVLYRGPYRMFTPAFSHLRLAHLRELLQTGIQFFALQVVGLVVFTSANLIITQLFGPSDVTTYNVAYKYFGIPAMVFTIILTPFWSAYTDAFTRGDFPWIIMTFRKLRLSLLVLALALLVMVVVADDVYAFWVGRSIHVPPILTLFMAFYTLLVAWNNIFAYFINGTGRIRLQLIVSALICAIFIPLALLLAGMWDLRSAGVILATCLVLLPGAVLTPIQAYKLIHGRASGLWAK
jgi:O-antigen/teichoic acid export membrane protein